MAELTHDAELTPFYGITLLNNNDILVCVLLDIIKG